MKQNFKYFILTALSLIFVLLILKDYMIDIGVIYYLYIAILIFCTEAFIIWGYNKIIISIFQSKKVPVSKQIRIISDTSISIAAIITGYQMGIEFGIKVFEEFKPPLDRINNSKIFVAVLFFILFSVFINMFWGVFCYIKEETKNVDTKSMKQKIMKTKLSTPFLLIIIAVIIIFIPWLFTRETFFPDFSTTTGAIGDTIGGITAPFISGLAALLVYIAFKEQVKANKSFMNMEERKIIIEQISYLQHFDILQLVNRFESLYSSIGKDKKNEEFEYICGKLKVLMSEINDLELQIGDFKGDKVSLKLKLKNTVTDLFIDSLYRITNLDADAKLSEDYVGRVNEILEKRNELASRCFS